jgi:hypothetical protein
MAEILGIGCTHRPVMLRPNEARTFSNEPPHKHQQHPDS